jgi:hypothetical protein
MIDGKEAKIVGLLGELDTKHTYHTELHPVFALAIKVADETIDRLLVLRCAGSHLDGLEQPSVTYQQLAYSSPCNCNPSGAVQWQEVHGEVRQVPTNPGH